MAAVGPVSCVAVSKCVMFGSGITHLNVTPGHLFPRVVYTWTWNGAKWTLRRTPSSGGYALAVLSSARCFSLTSCVVAGATSPASGGPGVSADRSPLLATWNGNALIPIGPKLPSAGVTGEFTDVSCVSGASCAAVGTTTAGTAFFDVRSGGPWSFANWPGIPHAATAALSGISCVSKSRCIAVGYYTNDALFHAHAVAFAWNGKKWTSTKVPGPPAGMWSVLRGVSCVTAANCTAIGETGKGKAAYGPPVAAHWNGATWKLMAV
jgi:hypothetical protein